MEFEKILLQMLCINSGAQFLPMQTITKSNSKRPLANTLEIFDNCSSTALTSTVPTLYAPLCGNMTSSKNRKYPMYCIIVGG